ncbi:MAG TPA: sigma-E factor negative regulatory protein [Casimicrobiaceae bacterium]|jgi:negative regulator of sigma E activity
MVMGNFKAGSGAGGAGGPTMPTPEEVSLLIDGELDPVRADAVVTGLCRSEGVANWVCYHVIGDALRGCAARNFDSKEFVELFAAEPTVLAPPRRAPAPHAIALALAATVAAVSVVGWVALTTMPAPVAAIASARQAVGVRAADARPVVDNEYVLVHQEYSPTNAIQGIGPYLRAVAASQPDARP